MARATVELPSLLAPFVDGARVVEVRGATLGEALAALVELHPALRTHLYDESGGFRRHVLCFHNRVNTRWLSGEDPPLADGDTITILQAVSGG